MNGTNHHRHEFKKDSDEVVVDLYTQFTIVGVRSLRVCELCGRESVDGKSPKDSCDEARARKVMES